LLMTLVFHNRRVEEMSFDTKADDSNDGSVFSTPQAGRERRGAAATSTNRTPPGACA
jgi:hypothetical protein